LPARQLYVHQDGASWDFLIIQPDEDWTDEAARQGQAELTRLGAPQGAKILRRDPQIHGGTHRHGGFGADDCPPTC